MPEQGPWDTQRASQEHRPQGDRVCGHLCHLGLPVLSVIWHMMWPEAPGPGPDSAKAQ